MQEACNLEEAESNCFHDSESFSEPYLVFHAHLSDFQSEVVTKLLTNACPHIYGASLAVYEESTA